MDEIAAHEHAITAYALEQLQQVGGLTILGPTEAVDRGGAISFELDGVHPHDVSQVLDSLGRRRPRRAPLRQAGARAVRRAVVDAGVVLPLHDAAGDRRAGRGMEQTKRFFKV